MDNEETNKLISDIIEFIKIKYDVINYDVSSPEGLGYTKGQMIDIIVNHEYYIEYRFSDKSLVKNDYIHNEINLTKEFNRYLLLKNRDKVIDDILTKKE